MPLRDVVCRGFAVTVYARENKVLVMPIDYCLCDLKPVPPYSLRGCD